MEIFGIGGLEIALVIIIALVVAGPARMLVWSRNLGRWVAKMRQIWSVTAAQLQRELDDAGVDFRVPRDIPTRKAIVDELSRSTTVRELTRPVEEIQTALSEAQAEMAQVTTGITSATQPATRPATAAAASQPPAPAADENFGTWGQAAAPAPSDTTDFGSWGAGAEPKE